MKLKKSLSLALAMVMIISFIPALGVSALAESEFVNPFEDINENNWFYDNIMYAYAHGLMSGTDVIPMLFSPNMYATRSMIVTILYRMEDCPEATSLPNPFDDVANDKWYAEAITWAAYNDLVTGYDGNRFGPDDTITRQDLLTLFNRYLEFAGTSLPELRGYEGFDDDSAIAGYAKGAVVRFYNAGIVSGKPGNIFDPNGKSTRAEVAAILAGLIKVTETP